MATTLLTISLMTALLYLLFSVVRALRQRPGGTFFTTLLATATLVTALLAVYLPAQVNADTRAVVLALGAALAAAGLVLLLLERRRPEHKLSDSRGILAMATGVLLFVGLFAGPFIAQAVTPPLPATPAAVPAAGVDSTLALTSSGAMPDVEVAFDAPVVSPTASPTPMASATPLPPRPVLPSPTPTNTPVVIVTWVPTEEAAVAQENAPADCVGFVQNNLNLRAEPSMDGELLVTIPSGTALNIAGTSDDSGWLRTTYGQMSGWVSADYVLLGDACESSSPQTQ